MTESFVHEESMPDESMPDELLPEELLPEEPVLTDSVPEGSVPEGSVPEGSVPAGSVPVGAVPDDQPDLVHELSSRVRQVDGVTALYDARSVTRATVTAVASRLVGRALVEPVVVSSAKGGLTVTVSLAVSESRPAAETCRRVFDVIHDVVSTSAPGDTLSSVRIRVSRIG